MRANCQIDAFYFNRFGLIIIIVITALIPIAIQHGACMLCAHVCVRERKRDC